MTRNLRGSLLAALAALVTMALAGAGCSSDDGAATSDEPVTAEQVLIDAAAAMAQVETAAFTLEQTGADVPIDDSGQLRFLSADGRIARPSSADAVVTVDALGFTTEVGAIAIDGTVWFTNPLTGEWTEAPASFTFDPAALLDPERGLAGLLAEIAPTAEFLDDADTPADAGPAGDGPWYHTGATVSGERVQVLTGGLLSESTTVEAWIDQDSDRLAELRFEVPTDEGVSDWRMTITDYDSDVEIAPPDLGSGP